MESPERALPAGFPGHSVPRIASLLKQGADTLRAFAATAAFNVDSPERSGRFTAQMRQRRNDSLYLSISPGLGIEAARILVSPDSVYLYDRIKNRLIVGGLEEAGRMLALPVTAEHLFLNLLGLITPDDTQPWDLSADDAYYYLSSPDSSRFYTIDPRVWRVIRYAEHDASDALVDERLFEDFDEIDGVLLPRRITFRRPQDDSFATLYYRVIELNPTGLSFDLNVSASARREAVGK